MRGFTEAFVLRRVRWSESSLILTLYSLDHGRMSGMAKGALRPKSPFYGRLEQFSLVRVGYSRREGRELDTVTDVDVLQHYEPLRSDPLAFAHACLFAEWMLVTVSGSVPSQPMFHLLGGVLSGLASGGPYWPVLCSGIERLLRLSGLAMEVDRCTRCGADAADSAAWDGLSGGVLCRDCGAGGPGRVPAGFLSFVRMSRRTDLASMERLRLWKGGFRESLEIMREFAQAHMGVRLRLRSLAVVEDLEDDR